MKNHVINVQGREITIISKHEDDYISITDIARHKNPEEPKDIVKNWMRSKTTIEFLGLWEKLHNPNFKGVEFDALGHATTGAAHSVEFKRYYIDEISSYE